MASTQIYFNYPTYSQHTLDLYSYCDDSYNSSDDEDYSDYENEIEYSLQQQDKLERVISGASYGSSGTSGGSYKHSNINKSTLALSRSKLTNNDTLITNNKHTKLQSQSTSSPSQPINKSPNQVKSVIEILDDMEQQKQDSKHKKAEVEKSNKLTSTQVEQILKSETESTKKERLPSTSEVYNRIKWEFANKVDQFTILYEDRFDGLVSSAFKEFEYDIIPHHRIQAFKYLDTIIYSRKDRIYNFTSVYNN